MVQGNDLEWSEEDIDALAEITPADVEHAAVWWRANAPKEAKLILDAEPDVPLE